MDSARWCEGLNRPSKDAGRWLLAVVTTGLWSLTSLTACSTHSKSKFDSTATSWGGQVLDTRNKPVERAQVFLLNLNVSPHGAETLIATTNSRGHWNNSTLRRFKASDALVIVHESFAPTFASFDSNTITSLANRNLQLFLQKGVDIRGRLLGANGDPIRNGIVYAFVPVSTKHIDTYWPIKLSSRPDGAFSQKVPTAGQYDMSFFATGYQPTTLKVRASSPSEPIEIVMNPYHHLLGRVVDSMNNPIADCTVEIIPKEDEFWESAALFVTEDGCATGAGGETWERRTNSEGEFEWKKLKNREYVVSISHPDYETRKLQLPTSVSRQLIVLSGTKDGQASSLAPK